MADAHFGHHRNRHGLHDFANHFDGRHARHPAFFADVRRHALQRHHRAGPGVFGDFRLFRVRDVHDHAAFEHFGEPDFDTPFVRAFIAVAAAIWLFHFHLASPFPLKTLEFRYSQNPVIAV